MSCAPKFPPAPPRRNGVSLQDRLELTAWLKDPSLFWLHPLGPLSNVTPEEWLAENQWPPLEKLRGVRVVHLLPSERFSF